MTPVTNQPGELQRNVMLETEQKQVEEIQGKPFPCPVCGMALPVEITYRKKPYCTCKLCGIQIFFRGKEGIKRLEKLLENKNPINEDFPEVNQAIILYNRLEKLKQKQNELKEKQELNFIEDQDLENTIAAIDGEIIQMQEKLEKTKWEAEKKNEKSSFICPCF